MSSLSSVAHPRDGDWTLPSGGGQVAEVDCRSKDGHQSEAPEGNCDVVIAVGGVQVDVPSGGIGLEKFLTTETNRELEFEQRLIDPEYRERNI